MSQVINLTANSLHCEKNERILFTDLSFTLQSGEILQILGANGSGKTSVLQILTGLSAANRGEVLWCGQSISDVRRSYNQQLGYIGHVVPLKQAFTVKENIHFAGIGKNKSNLFDVIQQVGLTAYQNTTVAHLSAGQQRRVALACLLIQNAKLWILDEPFVSLDKAGRELMIALLQAHQKNQGLAIFSAHHQNDLSKWVTQEISL